MFSLSLREAGIGELTVFEKKYLRHLQSSFKILYPFLISRKGILNLKADESYQILATYAGLEMKCWNQLRSSK